MIGHVQDKTASHNPETDHADVIFSSRHRFLGSQLNPASWAHGQSGSFYRDVVENLSDSTTHDGD